MACRRQQGVLVLQLRQGNVGANAQQEEPVAAIALQLMPRTGSHSYTTYFTAGGNVRIPSSLS